MAAIMSEMTTAIESPQRSDEEVEAAMVLLGSGVPTNQVSEITGIPARTLRDWARSPTLADKYRDAIKQARTRIALRTSQIVERVLDDIEDGTVTVSPVQALTMWGISTDKVQKDEPQHTASGTTISVFVGVIALYTERGIHPPGGKIEKGVGLAVGKGKKGRCIPRRNGDVLAD